MNPYEILGIDPSATLQDIKTAYRNLSKEHHPDVEGDEDKFIEITIAYKVLSDPNKRKLYDTQGIIMDDSPDNMSRIVKTRLATLAEGWLDNMIRGKRVSLKPFMLNEINNALNNIDNGTKEVENAMDKLEKIKEQVSTKGDKVIHTIIEKRIEMCKNGINQNKNEKEIVLQLQQLIEDYDFDGEDSNPIPTHVSMNIGTTGTSFRY